jgi:putative transposase
MMNAFLSGLQLFILVLGGHKQVALENIALRQQLTVYMRNVHRPKLRQRDRLFWIALTKIWTEWRSALLIVRPHTVIDWQRRRFKRYWWKLSQPKGPGRPRVSDEVRNLVRTMAAANPLWGAPHVHG